MSMTYLFIGGVPVVYLPILYGGDSIRIGHARILDSHRQRGA
jgi:hypothetical protein